MIQIKNMIGLLIISHGEFSKGIANSISMFYEQLEQFDTLSVNTDTNIDIFKTEIAEKIKQLDNGDGVLILADLFGGSPCNSTFNYLKDNVDVVTGVNFPMILSAICNRNITNNKEELVEKIIAESIAGIIHVNKKLEGVL